MEKVKNILDKDIQVIKGLIGGLEAEFFQIQERTKEREEKIRLLYDSLESVSLKAQVLQEINEMLGLDLDPDDLLSLIMDSVLKIMRTDAGSLLLLDREKNRLVFKITKGPKAEGVKSLDIPLDEGIAGWVVRENEPLIVPNPMDDRRFMREIAEEIGYLPYNILCVPLKIKREVIGAIEVINTIGKEEFTKDDQELLMAIGNQIAILIENSRLFHDLIRKVSEKTVLTEVAKTVNSSLSLDEVLGISMKLTSQIMRAEASSILLLDEEKKELVFRIALGKKGEDIKEVRIPLGEGIAGWVAKTEEPLVVSDVKKDDRFFKKADEISGFITRDIICVPLKIRDRIIGVAEAVNRIGGTFTEDDIELFEAIAFQIAISLENASLYKDLEDLFFQVITSLVATIDTKDPYTHGHSQRVMEYSLAIGREMKLSFDEMRNLKLSALLHDIGKIGVDEAILRKPAKLTEDEFSEVKKHPGTGAYIIEHIKRLKDISINVKHHHERFEGGGYPSGIKGKEIPISARIIAVSDAFDAITSDRPYRKGQDPEIAIAEIERCKETQFDPECVSCFIKAYREGKIKKKEEIKLAFLNYSPNEKIDTNPLT